MGFFSIANATPCNNRNMASIASIHTNLKAEFRGSVAGLKRAKTLKAVPIDTRTEAKVKVAINGFGRIGRNFVRCWMSRGADTTLEVVCVNQSGGAKPAAHLLKYDSILGTFDADVKVVDDATITVNGKPIKVVSDRDPLNLPWKEMGIDIVIEGTGVFLDGPGAGKHIQAGAKKVVITAPAKGNDIPTYVVGVNADQYDPSANIVSNASCTTNCLAPFAKVLDEKFGIIKGTMTTCHSYTGDQRILDASHRDLRRARAAALNIVPTPNVSIVDLVCNVEKKGVTAEEVNAAFKEAADGPMKGVLAITETPLVSVDFRCSDVSTTIDAALTMVMGDDMVKVVAWYDNEWGYTQRVVDLTHIVAKGLIEGGDVSADPMDALCADDPSAEECKVFD